MGHCSIVETKKGKKVLAFLRIFLCFTTATTRSTTVKAFLCLHKTTIIKHVQNDALVYIWERKIRNWISATAVLFKSNSFRLAPSKSVNTSVTFAVIFSPPALNILWRRPIKQQKLRQCSPLWKEKLTNSDSVSKQYHSANITLNDPKEREKHRLTTLLCVFYSPKNCPLYIEKISVTVAKIRCCERHQDEKFCLINLP